MGVLWKADRFDDARVLVVDDDPVMRETVAKALGQAGYETIRASSGEIAMKFFDHQPAELLVFNVRTQDGDGLETVAEMKRRWPGMKVLGISQGPKGVGYRRAATAVGASRTLLDPFAAGELIRFVREMVTP